MPRRGFFALLLVITMASSAFVGLQGNAQAQDATPPSIVEESSGGAKFRPLAAGSVEVLSPSVANLVMGRLSMDPGASVPFIPEDPSAVLLFVSSGEMTFQVNVPMTVARATGNGATPTPPEEIAADDEFTLREGDSAIFPGSMTGEVRNDGAEDASALIVNVIHLVTEPA